MTREAVSINHAAERASVSRRCVYRWIQEGKVECVRTAGGQIRVYVDTLFQTVERQPLDEADARVIR